MPSHPSHNGIALGPGSPLLTETQARRRLQPSEEDMQIAAFTLLVGPAVPGRPRTAGGGMTPKYPELMLLYAIPNGGARSKRTAGRMKAQGVLASVPDVHLPVMRGPFASLYVELKVPGETPTEGQRDMHDTLRQHHHCVLVCWSVEQFVASVLGYLALPKGEPGLHPSLSDRIQTELRTRQVHYHDQLQPGRLK